MSIFSNKFFKVTLPLATATTASIITAYLIISTAADKDKSKEEDQALENIELKSKEFEEELIKGPEEFEKDTKQGQDSPESQDLKKEKQDEDPNPKKSKPEEELKDMDQISAILDKAGKDMVEHMKSSKNPNEADEVSIKVNEKLHADSTSSKSSSQSTVAESEQKAGIPLEDKGLTEEVQQDGLVSNEEEKSKAKGEPVKEEQGEAGGNKASKEILEADSAVDSREEENHTELSREDKPSVPSSEKPESSLVEQGEEADVEETQEASGEPSGSPSTEENSQLQESGSEEAGRDLEKNGGEESSDSDGSNDNGGATVENLKLFENLKQQLFNQIDSMKRFL